MMTRSIIFLIMTPSISNKNATLSIATVSMTTLSITILCNMTLSIRVLSIGRFSIIIKNVIFSMNDGTQHLDYRYRVLLC
jgi:hypothetical protein